MVEFLGKSESRGIKIAWVIQFSSQNTSIYFNFQFTLISHGVVRYDKRRFSVHNQGLLKFQAWVWGSWSHTMPPLFRMQHYLECTTI